MLIGAGIWAVTLGRFDVHYAISTMARFNILPREGHLKELLRVFGYLKHFAKRRIIIDTETADHSNLKFTEHNWSELYPDSKEELPPDMPEPKGNSVKIIIYFDADHAHDLETRRSVTGIFVLFNNTPIRWYSKRQNTVETSTYGSELVAARIAVEIAMEMRYKLRMLGVPIDGPTTMFGDNKSVILNTTLPSSTLKKKHNAIAYHRVREAVASGVINLVHIPSGENISDLLTKPHGPSKHYDLMKRYLI